jgi:hypothetical protein
MQPFPIPAQADLPDVERSDGEWNKQQTSGSAEEDIRLFHDGLREEIPGDAVIEVQENQDVNYGHHHRVQAERPAALEQLRQPSRLPSACRRVKGSKRDAADRALLDGLWRLVR